jgi:hypothetical protein
MPWNMLRGAIIPMECKFRIKTVVLLFASLGTGIFLGAIGCLHYDIHTGLHTLNRVIFSTDNCPPERELSKVLLPKQQEEEAVGDPPKPTSPSKVNLQHGMSDEELLWDASLIHRRQAIPPQNRRKLLPKVAFMFLTRGPLPLAPLWEYFFATYDELYSIYVHADPSYVPNTSPSSVFYLRNIPSQV